MYRAPGMSKRTSYGKIYHPNVRVRPCLPYRCDFTRKRFSPSAVEKICLRGCLQASARTHSLLTSPPLPSPPSYPCRRRLLSARTGAASTSARTLEKNKNKNKIKIYHYYFGSCCRLEKRKKNFGFRFSIPKIPELRGLRGRSCEKKKVFLA
jgi:hypothetical protein